MDTMPQPKRSPTKIERVSARVVVDAGLAFVGSCAMFACGFALGAWLL